MSTCRHVPPQIGPVVVKIVVPGECGVGGVAPYDLDTLGQVRPTAAVDHPDTFTPAHELVHYRHPNGTGAEDHVQFVVVCATLLLRSLRSEKALKLTRRGSGVSKRRT